MEMDRMESFPGTTLNTTDSYDLQELHNSSEEESSAFARNISQSVSEAGEATTNLPFTISNHTKIDTHKRCEKGERNCKERKDNENVNHIMAMKQRRSRPFGQGALLNLQRFVERRFALPIAWSPTFLPPDEREGKYMLKEEEYVERRVNWSQASTSRPTDPADSSTDLQTDTDLYLFICTSSIQLKWNLQEYLYTSKSVYLSELKLFPDDASGASLFRKVKAEYNKTYTRIKAEYDRDLQNRSWHLRKSCCRLLRIHLRRILRFYKIAQINVVQFSYNPIEKKSQVTIEEIIRSTQFLPNREDYTGSLGNLSWRYALLRYLDGKVSTGDESSTCYLMLPKRSRPQPLEKQELPITSAFGLNLVEGLDIVKVVVWSCFILAASITTGVLTQLFSSRGKWSGLIVGILVGVGLGLVTVVVCIWASGIGRDEIFERRNRVRPGGEVIYEIDDDVRIVPVFSGRSPRTRNEGVFGAVRSSSDFNWSRGAS